MDLTVKHRPLSNGVPTAVGRGEAITWINPRNRRAADVLPDLDFSLKDVGDAKARWTRFAPLLTLLFPELKTGAIDSRLFPLSSNDSRSVSGGRSDNVWVKADHELPVTGCIKARGGVYEVLVYAEALAMRSGNLQADDSYARLAEPFFREIFGAHIIAVGSTGNLGFSVGVMARALGFEVEVHMSSDAKAWKKTRLRDIGAWVVEHQGDYGSAVAAARQTFQGHPDAHFIDDEDSSDLFLGYATAAFGLQRQLAEAGIAISEDRPLYVYLPCGVGGAPGGVTFGLKLLFGDDVHCVFVEPVASPCMLVQLAAGLDSAVSVYDFGLDNKTAADGLAVPRASMLVAEIVDEMLEGIVTVSDKSLFTWMKHLWTHAGLRLEPSAAAGFAALEPFLSTTTPRNDAVHVVWTTGGSLLPDDEFRSALERAGSS